jgi:hypothetical protein
VTKPGKTFKKIAVKMPASLFERIAARAIRRGVSFSEEAARLLDCGLFDYEESEQHDADDAA